MEISSKDLCASRRTNASMSMRRLRRMRGSVFCATSPEGGVWIIAPKDSGIASWRLNDTCLLVVMNICCLHIICLLGVWSMSVLLHIDSSPMLEGSVTRQLSAAFVARWVAANPAGRVLTRDLYTTPLAPIDAAW